jgi:hypothetical protein
MYSIEKGRRWNVSVHHRQQMMIVHFGHVTSPSHTQLAPGAVIQCCIQSQFIEHTGQTLEVSMSEHLAQGCLHISQSMHAPRFEPGSPGSESSTLTSRPMRLDVGMTFAMLLWPMKTVEVLATCRWKELSLQNS